MESDSSSTHRNDNGGSRLYSVFQKTVCLTDWWLMKAEADSSGKRLAVGGTTSREKPPVRTFSSAPIVKRYDVFTLETADGICVILKGFLNKSLTSGNGFPEEVFKHFVFGFPHNWEHYAVNCFDFDFSTTAVPGNIADPNNSASPVISSKVGTRSDSCRLSSKKPPGSKKDTDQHLGCKSDGIIFSNLSEEKPVIPTSVHGHHMSAKCQSAQKSDANLRGNLDDIVTQVDEEFKNSIKVPISPCCPVNTKHKSDTKIPASSKKTKRKLHLDTPKTPVTRLMKGQQKSIISPECLSHGQTRSGRLLLPRLEFWRNQLPVYDADRRLTGIQDGLRPSGSCTGSRSEPPTKPKRQAMVRRGKR